MHRPVFAETPAEESLILKEFIKLLKNYNTIISFNGIGFDIPFLKARFSKYDIDEDFSSYNFIDIFKSITPLKPLLKLENYKQKTLEEFLQINRDDTYSGGDLINIYSEYIKKSGSRITFLPYAPQLRRCSRNDRATADFILFKTCRQKIHYCRFKAF